MATYQRGVGKYNYYDVVKVRYDISTSMPNTNGHMASMRGDLLIIKADNGNAYRCIGSQYAWEDFMLIEPTKEEIISKVVNDNEFARYYEYAQDKKRGERA